MYKDIEEVQYWMLIKDKLLTAVHTKSKETLAEIRKTIDSMLIYWFDKENIALDMVKIINILISIKNTLLRLTLILIMRIVLACTHQWFKIMFILFDKEIALTTILYILLIIFFILEYRIYRNIVNNEFLHFIYWGLLFLCIFLLYFCVIHGFQISIDMCKIISYIHAF